MNGSRASGSQGAKGALPFTPTLSLRERENHSPPAGDSKPLDIADGRNTALPPSEGAETYSSAEGSRSRDRHNREALELFNRRDESLSLPKGEGLKAVASNPARRTLSTTAEPACVVLFDGRCSLCQASRKWLARLDWFGGIEWANFRDARVRAAVPQLSDEQLEKEMWVFTSSGRTLAGFEAWRHLLRVCPLTFLPSLLFYIPPVPWFGKRVYAFIAARRPITCQIQPTVPMKQGAWETILQRAANRGS